MKPIIIFFQIVLFLLGSLILYLEYKTGHGYTWQNTTAMGYTGVILCMLGLLLPWILSLLGLIEKNK